jgi:hypothetical protein
LAADADVVVRVEEVAAAEAVSISGTIATAKDVTEALADYTADSRRRSREAASRPPS